MAASGLGIKTTFDAVLRFEKIQERAKKGRDRTIKRSAGILRTIWRRSIRYRKKGTSSSGKIPFTHVKSGSFGLRSILWSYDAARGQAIIGPIGGSENTGAPKALELGGRSNIKLSIRDRRRLGRKYVSATIRKRPSGGPALETFSTSYPDLWKDAVQ